MWRRESNPPCLGEAEDGKRGSSRGGITVSKSLSWTDEPTEDRRAAPTAGHSRRLHCAKESRKPRRGPELRSVPRLVSGRSVQVRVQLTRAAPRLRLRSGNAAVSLYGTFSPEAGGRRLTFEPAGNGRFLDRGTRSTWNLSGRAIAGELAGAQLTEIVHGNYFWFSWAIFRPDTEIWRGR